MQQWEDRQKDQKDQPTEMIDQQYKQPWRKSNQLTVKGKDGMSAVSSNKKVCNIYQQL